MKAAASGPCRLAVPTKMAKAVLRATECAATRMAVVKENTVPMLANVRSTPDVSPSRSGGDAFITAELLAE